MLTILVSFILIVIGTFATKLFNKSSRENISSKITDFLKLTDIQQTKIKKRFKFYYILGDIVLFLGLLIMLFRIV